MSKLQQPNKYRSVHDEIQGIYDVDLNVDFIARFKVDEQLNYVRRRAYGKGWVAGFLCGAPIPLLAYLSYYASQHLVWQ